MKSNVRYIKPSGTSRRAVIRTGKDGKLLSSRPARMHRGFEIRGSGAGFHHVLFNGIEIATGLRNLADARECIDKLCLKVPNVGSM